MNASIELRLQQLEQQVTELRAILFPVPAGDPPETATSKVASIQWLCARQAGISMAQLLGRSREEIFAWPRMAAMFLARKHTGCRLQALGRLFKRNHGTILHAMKRVQDRISTDQRFAAAVATLETQLAAQPAGVSQISNLKSSPPQSNTSPTSWANYRS